MVVNKEFKTPCCYKGLYVQMIVKLSCSIERHPNIHVLKHRQLDTGATRRRFWYFWLYEVPKWDIHKHVYMTLLRVGYIPGNGACLTWLFKITATRKIYIFYIIWIRSCFTLAWSATQRISLQIDVCVKIMGWHWVLFVFQWQINITVNRISGIDSR